MTNDEIFREAVQRVIDFDETPVEAVATVVIRDIMRKILEEFAVAHLMLVAQ